MATLKDDEMLIITRELVESLRRRLLNPGEAGRLREELSKMLEIKETLFWRADVGPCCVGRAMSAGLFGEVQLLETTLEAFDTGDYRKAASSLDEFVRQAERNGSA
jgi:hypothetical protein